MTNIVIPVPTKLVQIKDAAVDASSSVKELVKSRVDHIQRVGARTGRIFDAVKDALKTE